MHKITTSLLFCTILSATAHVNPDGVSDFYFRKMYCNNDLRTPVNKLPEHLLDACQKSNLNPDDIHVFKENSYPDDAAYTIGSNIILTNRFWTLDQDQQAWYFAHELSHVKHDHIGDTWKLDHKLADFQIASSIIATATTIALVATKRIHTLPAVIGAIYIWGLTNVVTLFGYFKKHQKMELRADDDASRAVGPDGGISLAKQSIWERSAGSHTMSQRFYYYTNLLGFCKHGSSQLRLARLEKIKKEMGSK